MKILLFGASGMIGSRIAAEARGRGHEVTGVTRQGTDGTRTADAADAGTVATLAVGHDAVVLAVRQPQVEPLLAVGRATLDGMREAGVRRLAVVGGAGSLEVAPGVRVIDRLTLEDIPEEYRYQVPAQVALLELIQANADDLEWTYLSPPVEIEPGDRTGTYRVGANQLLSDEAGHSRISAEDYAAALIDELETGRSIRRHITVAY
ncbi:NAD(P)-dependent oxidoreductase [Streptomyces sp. NPDC090499]|uniref:NAD(P)-dependent oxidoreductase n=1 Tax=Streptomyces sp. NPDC090499 TaxID=3365965 RepID=UPI003801FCC1